MVTIFQKTTGRPCSKASASHTSHTSDTSDTLRYSRNVDAISTFDGGCRPMGGKRGVGDDGHQSIAIAETSKQSGAGEAEVRQRGNARAGSLFGFIDRTVTRESNNRSTRLHQQSLSIAIAFICIPRKALSTPDRVSFCALSPGPSFYRPAHVSSRFFSRPPLAISLN